MRYVNYFLFEIWKRDPNLFHQKVTILIEILFSFCSSREKKMECKWKKREIKKGVFVRSIDVMMHFQACNIHGNQRQSTDLYN